MPILRVAVELGQVPQAPVIRSATTPLETDIFDVAAILRHRGADPRR